MREWKADSIIETYECSINNNPKKIKRNLENAVYEVTWFGKPVIYAILANVFESNDLQISNYEKKLYNKLSLR